jgi:hypothetical protein
MSTLLEHALEDEKSFTCMNTSCASGTITLPKGTKAGTLVTHDCGGQGVLANEGRVWSLSDKDDPNAPDIIETLNLGAKVETTEKKKRGRPKGSKNVAAGVTEAAAMNETPADEMEFKHKLMQEVEADCPYPRDDKGFFLPEGQDWVWTEFNKRKAEIENDLVGGGEKTPPEAATEKPKRGRKAKQSGEILPPEPLDKEFVGEAKASDKRIDKALRRGGESFFEAIKELVSSGEKNYYKALGFKTFDKYRESKTEYSRSHIGQGMQVYKALHGRVDDEKLMAMPLPTAVLLTKIPESKLTDEVIASAGTMTIVDFKEKQFPKLMSALVDASTGEREKVEEELFSWTPRYRVHKQVADRFKRLIEIATWKSGNLIDDADVYSNFNQIEKAILAIYLECCKSSAWEMEYEEHKHNTPAQEEAAF